MRPSQGSSIGLALSAAVALSAWASAAPAPFSMEERLLCQAAIEQVYAGRRSAGPDAGAVPPDVVRRKAQDGLLKSAALEQFWGLTLSDVQLQAELDRMAAHSQAPDVLEELFAALDGDAQRAAECLARPLLADRLIRSHYSRDERLHGQLETRARRELEESGPASLPRAGRGVYTELEWRRGPSREPGVIGLEPEAFEARVREVRRLLGGASGRVEIGHRSPLREDESRFYALSVLALDDQRLQIASVEWPKRSFDAWWGEVRGRVRAGTIHSSFAYRKPAPPGTRCRDDSWKPTLQLLDPRYWHTAVWTGAEMIVFGGMESVGSVYGDGSRYDPATDTWTLLSSRGAPGPRQAHVAVWTGREMVVWGGRGDTSGGRYDPVTDTWRPTSTANAPAPRWNASVVWTGTQMIVWGGEGGNVLNTGGRYDPASDTWTPLPTASLAPRTFHAAAWTGSQMVVWGGYNGHIGQMYADGARYDPLTNTWSPMAAAGAPNARFYHTAVWTGSEVVVWGGLNYPPTTGAAGATTP